MLELPVGRSNLHPSLGRQRLAVGDWYRWQVCMIDGARTVPSNVLVPVVRLAVRRKPVVRIGDLALDVAPVAGSLAPVVVQDLFAADDDARAEFAEDGPRGDDTDRSALVGVRDDVPVNQVALFVLLDDDLVQRHVLGEEQVAVAEAAAPCRLRRQHEELLSSVHDGKGANAVLASAQQVAILVHLFLARGVVGQDNLVLDHVGHGALLVDAHLGRRVRLAARPAPKPGRPAALPAERRALLGTTPFLIGGARAVPVRRAVLGRAAEPAAAWERVDRGRRAVARLLLGRRGRGRGRLGGLVLRRRLQRRLLLRVGHFIVGRFLGRRRRAWVLG